MSQTTDQKINQTVIVVEKEKFAEALTEAHISYNGNTLVLYQGDFEEGNKLVTAAKTWTLALKVMLEDEETAINKLNTDDLGNFIMAVMETDDFTKAFKNQVIKLLKKYTPKHIIFIGDNYNELPKVKKLAKRFYAHLTYITDKPAITFAGNDFFKDFEIGQPEFVKNNVDKESE